MRPAVGNVIQGITFLPMPEITSVEFYEEVWIL
jgi:hypothetical protein